MLNIARGNEIVSPVAGIALVDRAARRQAAVELRDAGLRAPGVQLPDGLGGLALRHDLARFQRLKTGRRNRRKRRKG